MIWWISTSLCNAGKSHTLPALSPPQSLEDGWRIDLYFIPGAMARAVQPSRASVARCGVLWSLGDCQGNPVEGVCAGQSGLATSLLHSRRFPLSPERSTGMQHGKFFLLYELARRVGWKLVYGRPHPSPYPLWPETLHPQQLLSVLGFQLRLSAPSSQKPVCRGQL